MVFPPVSGFLHCILPKGKRKAVVYQILLNFLDKYAIIILPHKSIGISVGNVFLLFGKNAFSALRSLRVPEDLCGNKWSYAFFVRSFGYALFNFIERRSRQ